MVGLWTGELNLDSVGIEEKDNSNFRTATDGAKLFKPQLVHRFHCGGKVFDVKVNAIDTEVVYRRRIRRFSVKRGSPLPQLKSWLWSIRTFPVNRISGQSTIMS